MKCSFVINSNKNFKDAFQILPLEKFDVYKFTNTNQAIERVRERSIGIFDFSVTIIYR